jgi:hypothetical protein
VDAFEVHRQAFGDYRDFGKGLVPVLDQRLQDFVQDGSARAAQQPDPWLSLDPAPAPAPTALAS